MSELQLRLAGDATVRATITADGEHLVSVYDFMNRACPGNSKSWASVTWSNLIKENSQFRHELSFTMVHLKYLGVRKGNNTRSCETPVMTLRGLQRLLMILGGRVAAEFRTIVEGVFTRYNAGDLSMIEEIRENAVSDAPIHQAYRQALAQEPVLDAAGEKRKLERQDALFELEIQERKLALEERKSHMGVEVDERKLALQEKKL